MTQTLSADTREDLEIFRHSVCQFIEREVAPIVEEYEARQEPPMHLFKRMGELGYLGLRYSEDEGGSGGDFLTLCVLMEELYRASAGIAAGIEIQAGLGTLPLHLAGTPEQKRIYFEPALRGERIAAFAMTEPEAGSDASGIRTKAVRQGDTYVLNGSKIYISNGGIADFVTVSARVEGGEGVTLFLVEKDTPGFAVGRDLETLGMRSSSVAELFFTDCTVPETQRLGAEGQGFETLMVTLDEGRVMVGAECVGLARAALDAALTHARERVQFGQPIGKFQSIRHTLADMATRLEAAKLLVYSAAAKIVRGEDARSEAAMAKLFASEMASWVTKKALHIHGGAGYMMDHPVQRYFRDAVINEIVEGTSEIQRSVIAKRLGL